VLKNKLVSQSFSVLTADRGLHQGQPSNQETWLGTDPLQAGPAAKAKINDQPWVQRSHNLLPSLRLVLRLQLVCDSHD
jgi:hypothetical protein